MIAVDGATHSQKNGVAGSRGSLKDGAEAFVVFLCGARLVLRKRKRTPIADSVNTTSLASVIRLQLSVIRLSLSLTVSYVVTEAY